MPRALLHRNIVLLVGVVLAGQLLAGLLVMALVVHPQTARVAGVTADMIEGLSTALAAMPPQQREATIARLNRNGSMLIRPLGEVPGDGPRFPTYIERQFMRALAGRLATQDRLVWRTDAGRRLWVRLTLGRDDYWVSITPPRNRGAMTSLLMAFAAAFLVASAGGLLLQRRLDRPLRRLAEAVDDYDPDRPHAALATGGPAEVAAVASAFNRMTGRLAEQEAERALMLGSVSHDLRTPLTRLRLSLEMMRGSDPELEETAIRQVDRIAAMLGQFLDFARGFESEPARPADIAALLRQVAADSGAPAVTLSVPEGLRAEVRPQALARAAANLLGNALRHGAAPFGLSAEVRDGRLRIAVSDGGAGIAEDAEAAMAQPFARGDAARGGEGAGLGLAIAARVARAHGGRLAFARSPQGFAAILDLPAARS
jgi:two-component system osmolarity sensor histidine kinase EnvZ